MLSMKAKYALRALLMLAKQMDGEPVMIAEIATTQQVPRKFLELILLELKRNGLVHSLRGRHGGYVLAKPPAEITFGRVVRLIDGPLAPVLCASMTAYRRCEDCEDEAACAIRKVFREVRDATAAILDGESLADALQRGRRRRRAEI
jgi:Rrf2 family protein